VKKAVEGYAVRCDVAKKVEEEEKVGERKDIRPEDRARSTAEIEVLQLIFSIIGKVTGLDP
jgi:hypothetical protein